MKHTSILVGMTIGALLVCSILYGVGITPSALARVAKEEAIKRIIQSNSIYEYSQETADIAIFEGVVKGVDDMYSRYCGVPLNSTQIENNASIGLTLIPNADTGYQQIIEIAVNSPAYANGIQVGDEVTHIYGMDIRGQTVAVVNTLMQGNAGSTVNITLASTGEEIQLERQEVYSNLIFAEVLENDIGYLAIKHIDAGASGKVESELNKLKSLGVKNLILDLRGNTGGLFLESMNIIELLIPAGHYGTRYNKGGSTIVLNASGEGVGIPVFVLVDEVTASSAEIIAQALRTNTDATLFGRKTYGKGVGQSTFELFDGSSLVLTSFTYVDLYGESFNEIGLYPDVQSIAPLTDVLNLVKSEREGDLK